MKLVFRWSQDSYLSDGHLFLPDHEIIISAISTIQLQSQIVCLWATDNTH